LEEAFRNYMFILMKYSILFLCLLAFESAIGQTTTPAISQPAMLKPQFETADANSTLRQRFQIMKFKSQSYNDYKVIKETVLDGIWKITTDSINANKSTLREARSKITSLETELKNTQSAYKKREAAVAEITYDGTHISVLGIPFEKITFITIVTVVVIALVVLLVVVMGRLKSLHGSIKEKEEAVNTTTLEFEDYKRKALERQTKLSRELQNERNKLTDIKRS